MILSLFLVLSTSAQGALALAGEVSQAASAAPSVLARHSLRGASVVYDSGAIEESLLLDAGLPAAREHLDRTRDFGEPPDEGVLAELVTGLFPEMFEYEGRGIDLRDGELFVLAPPDLQEKVRAAVRAIEATLAASVDLRVDVIDVPSDAQSPFGGRLVVDAAQADALRASAGRTRESYAVRLQAGRTSLVQRARPIPLLVDYDVELAQGSAIFDPIAGEAEAGTRILLRGSPAQGGIALSMILAHGAPLAADPIDLSLEMRSRIGFEKEGLPHLVDAPAALQRVDLAFRSAALDTFLPDGKALVIESGLLPGAAGPEGAARSRQVVVVQRTGGALVGFHRFGVEGGRAELIFVNADALAPPSLSVRAYQGDDVVRDVPMATARLETETDVMLADWISARFANWRSFGPWLVCVYDPTWDEDAAAQLEALVNGSRAETALIELDLRARAAGEEIASFRAPVRAGSRAAAMVGVTSTALVDYDVEVAQFAATPDPEIRTTFHGMCVLARPERGAEGTTVDVDARLQARRGAERAFQLGSALMSWIDTSAFDALRIAQRVDLAAGTPAARASLGDAGDPAAGFTLEVGAR